VASGLAHAKRLKSGNIVSGRPCAISPHSCHIGTSSVAQVTEQEDGKPAEQSPEGMASQHGRTTSASENSVAESQSSCARAKGWHASVQSKANHTPSHATLGAGISTWTVYVYAVPAASVVAIVGKGLPS
jgi:hypothetical protein